MHFLEVGLQIPMFVPDHPETIPAMIEPHDMGEWDDLELFRSSINFNQ
jgi:hypothetical protein